jgi:hypothetical protein
MTKVGVERIWRRVIPTDSWPDEIAFNQLVKIQIHGNRGGFSIEVVA